jgi:hypothetical protein
MTYNASCLCKEYKVSETMEEEDQDTLLVLDLVVIFWSCFQRCHLQIKPLVGILALLILLMGWLHSNG